MRQKALKVLFPEGDLLAFEIACRGLARPMTTVVRGLVRRWLREHDLPTTRTVPLPARRNWREGEVLLLLRHGPMQTGAMLRTFPGSRATLHRTLSRLVAREAVTSDEYGVWRLTDDDEWEHTSRARANRASG